VDVPSDGTVASYYAASLNEDAPHPAVARLWQEFVFSDEGQNLLLDGYVLPGRLDAMVKADTVDEDSLSKLLDDSVDQEAPQPTPRPGTRPHAGAAAPCLRPGARWHP